MHTTMMMEAEEQATPGGPSVLHVLVMSPDAFLSLPLPTSGTLAVGRSAKCRIRLDDPLASREHALLHVELSPQPEGQEPGHGQGQAAEGYVLKIEDLGSANGTRVRDRPIVPHQGSAFLPGEAITIGSTVLMVQHNRPAVGLRRLWSHGYFESRLEDECARAAETGSAFGLARVRVIGASPWTNMMPLLVRTIPKPHLFAAYGPRDYEILFVESPPQKVMNLMEGLASELRASKIDARHGVAWYPRDGRSADALIARANALVKHTNGAGKSDLGPAPGNSDDGEPMSGAGMERILELARRAAGANINVLILGETGVGKDVLARTIHQLSGRKGEFVALNCAGLTASLIESELFGHEKGAFSGASGPKIGLLEAANGGTVFLDEIGEMPAGLQVKLLRTIETREVLPVGAVRTRAIDVRFLAATHRDLEADVLRGTFRQDLFFRLNGISLSVPPLRERTSEIPALVSTFVKEACRESGRNPLPVFSRAALDHLRRYAWPGNIREMKNLVERALVLCDAPEITTEYLPLDKMRTVSTSDAAGGGTTGPRGDLELDADGRPPAPSGGATRAAAPIGGITASPGARSEQGAWQPAPIEGQEANPERQRILDALTACAWNQTRAAQSLGMPRRTFVSKLEHYSIPRPQKSGNGPANAQ
jgi:two-component system response regulator AtoC